MFDIPAEVKDLFEQDSVLKNYRIHFPNGECRDLNSSDMETESVEFTESICSMDSFMLGLNERSVFSFDAHNIPNIKNAEIEVTLQIDVYDLVLKGILNQNQYTKEFIRATIPEMYELFGIEYFYYYEIPIGKFVVEECQKQSDMTIRRVTAYTRELKLEKEYCNPLELAKYDRFFINRLSADTTSAYSLNATNFAIANLYTSFYSKDVGDIGGRNNFTDGKNVYGVTFNGNKFVDSNGRNIFVRIKMNYDYYSLSSENKDELFRFALSKSNKDILSSCKTYLKCFFEYAKDNGYDELNVNEASYPFEYDLYKRSELPKRFYNGDIFDKLVDGGLVVIKGREIQMFDYVYAYPYLGLNSSEIKSIVSYWGYLVRFGVITSIDVELEEIAYYPKYETIKKESKRFDIRNNSEDCCVYRSINKPGEYEDGYTNLYNYERMFINRYFEYERIKSKNVGYEGYSYMPGISQTDFTNIISSWLEINGFNTVISRTGSYRLKECVAKTAIYPENDLYPEDLLYPSGTDLTLTPELYSSAWFDDSDSKPYRYVYYTYTKKISSGEEKGYAAYDIFTGKLVNLTDMDASEFSVDSVHYATYEVSDNLFVTQETSWTKMTYNPYSAIAEGLKGFIYTPAQIESPGRPYLEVGDSLDVLMKDETAFNTIILRRTLKGIQSLRDSYESK